MGGQFSPPFFKSPCPSRSSTNHQPTTHTCPSTISSSCRPVHPRPPPPRQLANASPRGLSTHSTLTRPTWTSGPATTSSTSIARLSRLPRRAQSFPLSRTRFTWAKGISMRRRPSQRS